MEARTEAILGNRRQKKKKKSQKTQDPKGYKAFNISNPQEDNPLLLVRKAASQRVKEKWWQEDGEAGSHPHCWGTVND